MRKLMLCLALSGCTQMQAAQTQIQSAQSQVATFTREDIANAIAKAQAAGPAGAELVSCFTFIQSQLPPTPSATAPAGTIGLATAFVDADLALGRVGNVMANGAQSSFETACGALVVHLMNQGMNITSQIASLAKLMVKP